MPSRAWFDDGSYKKNCCVLLPGPGCYVCVYVSMYVSHVHAHLLCMCVCVYVCVTRTCVSVFVSAGVCARMYLFLQV